MLPIPTLCLSLVLAAQAGQEGEPKAPATTRPAEQPLPRVLEWPKHRDLALAELDGRPIRLAELTAHLEAHYDPRIQDRWKADDRELNSPNLPQLLYQYLDVLALRAEAEQQKLELHRLMERVDQFLATDFEQKFKPYWEQAMGRPMPETSVPDLRARHRREQGLRMEVEALLDRLVPGVYKWEELKQYNIRHGDFFGGKVQVAHIFLSTRDQRTGRRHPEGKQAEVRSRLREILGVLKDEPQRFDELARRYSEDSATAAEGGVLGWVTRLDDRLPAAIVRTAWGLDNGDISVPVESFHGIHIVMRLAFNRTHFILFNGKSAKQVADTRKRIEAEDYLFASRDRHARRFFL